MPFCFRPIEMDKKCMKHESYIIRYQWMDLLKDVYERHKADKGVVLKGFVSVHSFREHALKKYTANIEAGHVLDVEVIEHRKVLDQKCKVYWLAVVRKIAGYRLLMHWAGATDDEEDFWINIGSLEISSIKWGPKSDKGKETGRIYCPPLFLIKAWGEGTHQQEMIRKTMKSLMYERTLPPEFNIDQAAMSSLCKFKVGQRVEMVDYNLSTRVRPARVLRMAGRRVCVQVTSDDFADEGSLPEDDRQLHRFKRGFWVDQSSFFLFHVGWAALNGYNITAKPAYIEHAKKIANAIKKGTPPPYADIDAPVELFIEWTPKAGVQFEVGDKLELLDPLSGQQDELKVATVLEILQNGYLRIGMDGPDIEEDSLAIHCTYPCLFPVGYAKQFDIKLKFNDTTKFSWETYLPTVEGKPAPGILFKSVPTKAEIQSRFPLGWKLEASDLVENVLICPATVVAHKGRLLHVHFDGWETCFDMYIDLDANDIFPIGWCELNGFKLEPPKEVETRAKRRLD